MRTIAWAMPARVWLLALAVQTPARGQEAAISAYPLEEIIVTAQKWEQAANTVGMSITVATGEALLQYGITSVAGLTRLVPGLTIQESSFNSTSFTLRGVGFFNSDLATPPAVTVYLDEASLPYPAMTKLIASTWRGSRCRRAPRARSMVRTPPAAPRTTSLPSRPRRSTRVWTRPTAASTLSRSAATSAGRSAGHGLIAGASASTLGQAIRAAGGANVAESAEASGVSLES